MSEQRQVPDSRIWGCLGFGMITFGALFIALFEGVGGTQYDLEYTAVALIVAGVGVLLFSVAKRWRS